MSNILIACSGSVAAVKVPEIMLELHRAGYKQVRIILTKSAEFFWDRAQEYNPAIWKDLQDLNIEDVIYRDEDEWELWERKGDPVLHIELRKWADILIVCPASADILAKIDTGIADNLLLCTVRAWDFAKPAWLCPSMNTIMWQQSITEQTIMSLSEKKWRIISPVSKTLACNEVGIGALAPVSEIVSVISVSVGRPESKEGRDLSLPLKTRPKKFRKIDWGKIVSYIALSLFSAGVASLATWCYCNHNRRSLLSTTLTVPAPKLI
jgi:phosphopantothenoylcysteine decarboxylase